MLVRSISWGGGRAGVPSGLGGCVVLKPFITSYCRGVRMSLRSIEPFALSPKLLRQKRKGFNHEKHKRISHTKGGVVNSFPGVFGFLKLFRISLHNE